MSVAGSYPQRRTREAEIRDGGVRSVAVKQECLKRRLPGRTTVTGIERGVELVRRACHDMNAVPAAQQVLRNWRHRLDRLTVLDVAARLEVQSDMRALDELLGELHAESLLFSRRQADAIDRIEPIRRRLIALVGERGLD